MVVTASISHGQTKMKKAVRRGETTSTSIAIYDAYKINRVDKGFGEGPFITINELEPVGEQKIVSKLKSTAAAIECKAHWADEIMSKIKSGFKPADNFEADFWKSIKQISNLQSLSCATVDYSNFSIGIVYASIEAEPTDKKSVPNKLLWLSKISKNDGRLEDPLYAGVSIESNYSTIRSLSVKAIADTNGDGLHEVILKDTRWAGFSYEILGFTDTGLLEKKAIEGTSWD